MAEFAKKGFVRARVDGETVDLAEPPELDKQKKHSIDVIVDRLVVRRDDETRRRLADSLETAVRVVERPRDDLGRRREGGDGLARRRSRPPTPAPTAGRRSPRSRRASSPSTRRTAPAPACSGLGSVPRVDPDRLVPDPTLSIAEGAIALWKQGSANWRLRQIEQLSKAAKFSMDVPWKKLPADVRDMILHGSKDQEIKWKWKSEKGEYVWSSSYKGLVPLLMEKYKEVESEDARQELERFMSATPCPDCGGRRLKPEALAVKVRGRAIDALTGMTLEDAKAFFASFEAAAARAGDRREDPEGDRGPARVPERRRHRLPLARPGVGDALGRRGAADPPRDADRLEADGGPLRPRRALDRPPPEGQPQAHRHAEGDARPREHGRRRRARRGDDPVGRPRRRPRARARGSTAARSSGEGKAAELVRVPALADREVPLGRAVDPRPRDAGARGPGSGLSVVGARANNLQNITVRFPLGCLTAVTGVSGSGKSTLVNDILYRAAARVLHESNEKPGAHERIEGLEHVDKVIDIDQSPIGRTPRSNPATYTNLFGPIRDLMAQVPEARMRGYGPGRFSFNVKGGRCEACGGGGQIAIEMHFLPDVYVTCDVCGGQRYNRETLEVRYKGLSIAEVLDLTAEQAAEVFTNVPSIRNVAVDPRGGRPRLHQARPAGDDPLGRRGAAGEARPRAGQARDRPDALHPRRADDRPPLRRREEAPRRPPRARRAREHGHRHRAQPRRRQDGRPDRRPGARRGRPGRPRRRRGDARGGRPRPPNRRPALHLAPLLGKRRGGGRR